MEAPFIYMALDQLALRASSYAGRRQRALLAALSPGEAAAALTPELAAAVAGREVKQVRHHDALSSASTISRHVTVSARVSQGNHGMHTPSQASEVTME